MDRILWKTAEPLINNSEFIIGRLYRKFITKDKVNIRLVSLNYDDPKEIKIDKEALPNDPGYLMKNTSCPKPFDKDPMFEQDGEVIEYKIKHNNKEHKVKITYSMPKRESRVNYEGNQYTWMKGKKPFNGKDAGHTDHGQHARKNQGISLVRAGRELSLDTGLVIAHDVTERWWGVEIEFPPALDEIFGVANNKQSASNFQEISQTDIKEIVNDKQSFIDFKRQLERDEDPKADLIEIVQKISDRLSNIRGRLKTQTIGGRSNDNERHSGVSIDDRATTIIQERAEEGHTGTTDKQSKENTVEEKIQIIKEEMEEESTPKNIIDQVLKKINDKGVRIVFEYGEVGNSNFFDIKFKAGIIFIKLNTKHPAYPHLIEVLDNDIEDVDQDTLAERLLKARDGLKLLLIAWARYEDEVGDGGERIKLQDTRHDWGKIARKFLEKE